MFIKSVTMSYDHWSYKLQQWMFPSLPRFHNFCPHFWMTVVAIIASPFKAILMLLVWPLAQLEIITDSILKKRASGFLDKLPDEEFRQYYIFSKRWYYLDDETPRCLLRKYNNIEKHLRHCQYERWREIRDSMSEYSIEKETDIFKEKVIRELQVLPPPPPPIRTRPWWSKAVTVAKYVSSVLLIPLGYISYHTALAIGWCWYYIIRWPWGDLIIGILGAGGIIVVLGGIFYGLTRFIVSREFSMPRCLFCKKLGYGCLSVLKGIGMIFVFFWEGIKALKVSNCPEIKWKD